MGSINHFKHFMVNVICSFHLHFGKNAYTLNRYMTVSELHPNDTVLFESLFFDPDTGRNPISVHIILTIC